MDWNELLSETRIRDLGDGSKEGKESPDQRTQHGRDYDRAIFSTPVRRMQDKTQVFPLEPNDSVRTRLTHSLEVSNIARNMARAIADWIQKKGDINSSQANSIEMIAATGGLIHDLGNPPFGHAGEEAIRQWFENKEKPGDNFFNFNNDSANHEQLKQDFLKFEGNAQTIRLLSKLQVLADFHGLNLTCATMSAACKYIASSDKIKKEQHERKKPGFFASEQELIQKIQKKTGTGNKRNPITYIIEAADDIAFSVVDIEDAVRKGVVSWDIVKKELQGGQVAQSNGSNLLEQTFDNAEKIIDKGNVVKSIQDPGKSRDGAMVQAFRVCVIIESAKAVQEAFQDNYDDIMKGNYHNELYKDSKARALIDACKKVGKEYIYCAKENLTLELMGRRVITDLMDIFWEGASKGSSDGNGFAEKIYKLTSHNYRDVYESKTKESEGNFPLRYYQFQLLTDYICGMTDTFACNLHKRLTNG